MKMWNSRPRLFIRRRGHRRYIDLILENFQSRKRMAGHEARPTID